MSFWNYIKGYEKSLKVLNGESRKLHGISNRRVHLAKALEITNLIKENKGKSAPLDSIFEILVQTFFCSFHKNTKSTAFVHKNSQTDPTELISIPKKTDSQTQTDGNGTAPISGTLDRLENLENFMQTSGNIFQFITRSSSKKYSHFGACMENCLAKLKAYAHRP